MKIKRPPEDGPKGQVLSKKYVEKWKKGGDPLGQKKGPK